MTVRYSAVGVGVDRTCYRTVSIPSSVAVESEVNAMEEAVSDREARLSPKRLGLQ